MKKLLRTTACLAVMSLTGTAQASDIKSFNPYVGIDLQRSIYNYNDNYDIGGGQALI